MRSISLRKVHLHLGQFIGETIVEKPITQIRFQRSSEVTIVSLLVRKLRLWGEGRRGEEEMAHRKRSGEAGV